MAEKNEEIVTKAVEWVKRKGYSKVKANVGELEAPTSFTQREGGENGEDAIITPDITAVMRGNKCYFEIAMKSDDKQDVITKWKLLDRLGWQFQLLALDTRPPPVNGLPVLDLTGQLTPDLKARYLGTADSALYLIRPDQHIAARWATASATDIQSALARAMGHTR